MEFFEFVFLFSVAFVLPLTILKMALDYKKARVQARTGGGEGVTAGELRRLLRDAVEEANAPLLARIDEIEARMLPAGRDEEIEDDFIAEPQERTLGRRAAE